jgi:hypothetical protein
MQYECFPDCKYYLIFFAKKKYQVHNLAVTVAKIAILKENLSQQGKRWESRLKYQGTKKPQVVTKSQANHHPLSVFYLESREFSTGNQNLRWQTNPKYEVQKPILSVSCRVCDTLRDYVRSNQACGITHQLTLVTIS